MATMIRRNLVIGLGGTGLNVVYELKRKYQEVLGTQRPFCTKFLVLDTTDFEPSQGVTLHPAEFIKLEVPDAGRVLQHNKSVQRWFPTDPAIPLGKISSGTSQLRPLGRLALFHNAERVRSGIRVRISEVAAIEPSYEEGGIMVSGQSILVQVVGSLSGGTGSGTFLDVARICRNELSDEFGSRGELVGMMLLPDAFIGKPETTNVEANAYAAMKELDYDMGLTQDQTFEYDFSSVRTLRVDRPTFSTLFLVNNINRKGLVFRDIRDVHHQMSLAMYIASVGAGKIAHDFIDSIYSGPAVFHGKLGHYASVGVSELVVDREQLAGEMTLRAAIDSIAATFGKTDRENLAREALEFLEANQLVAHEEGQPIDALLPPRDVPEPPLDDVMGRNDLALLPGIADAYLDSVRVDAQRHLDEVRPVLQSARMLKLQDRLTSELGRPGGLPRVIAFLKLVIGRLEAFRDEVSREAEEYERAVGEHRHLCERFIQRAQARGGSILTGRRTVRKIVKQLEDLLLKEGQVITDRMRHRGAEEVYSALLDLIRQKLLDLNGLRERVELVERRLQRELEGTKEQRTNLNPFKIAVEIPQRFRVMTLDSRAFITWVQDSGGSIEALATMDAESLAQKFSEFGRSLPEVRSVASLTIDDVLRGMTAEESMRYIKRLNDMAAPMWDYDEATVQSVKATKEILFFGVENMGTTALDREELKDNIAMTGHPFFVDVGDPERIYIYQMESGIPAFAVRGMHRYKQAFERLRRTTPLHLEPEFNQDPARDLWPDPGPAQALRAWSLANAGCFGLIERTGGHYLVRSERKGAPLENFMVTLGRGRVNTSEAFMGDPELVDEVLESVRKTIGLRGADAIFTELRAYSAELVKEGREAVEPKVKSLIAAELDAIDEYISENTTMI
jgi:hypothetical protein